VAILPTGPTSRGNHATSLPPEQFDAFLDEPPVGGRKLDFLTQEIFREVNTIGSKANNVAIAHGVVEMKSRSTASGKVLQNVE